MLLVVVVGGGSGGWRKYEQLEHGGFLEQWTTSDDIIMVDIWHYTFVQTHGI